MKLFIEDWTVSRKKREIIPFLPEIVHSYKVKAKRTLTQSAAVFFNRFTSEKIDYSQTVNASSIWVFTNRSPTDLRKNESYFFSLLGSLLAEMFFFSA